METEKEHAIKEINNSLSSLADVCRSKEKYGKEKDTHTIRAALDGFHYTVGQFAECLPQQVIAQIKKREDLADKMAKDLIEKLNKRQNSWSI